MFIRWLLANKLLNLRKFVKVLFKKKRKQLTLLSPVDFFFNR